MKPHRKCTRCDQPACKPTGNEAWAKLCHIHNQERRARQAASRARPKCGCGGTRPKDADQCRGCAEKVERECDRADRELNLDHYVIDTLQSRLRSLAHTLIHDHRYLESEAAEADAIANELELLK